MGINWRTYIDETAVNHWKNKGCDNCNLDSNGKFCADTKALIAVAKVYKRSETNNEKGGEVR
jgi:hypothetical protein